jgi:hypothetical protein
VIEQSGWNPPPMDSCHWHCCSLTSWQDESRHKVTKVVWRGVLAPWPATCTSGESKQRSETVVCDGRQGSCLVFCIECCRSFATSIARHPHYCKVGEVHKSATPTDARRFHSQCDGGSLPRPHVEWSSPKKALVVP